MSEREQDFEISEERLIEILDNAALKAFGYEPENMTDEEKEGVLPAIRKKINEKLAGLDWWQKRA